MPPEWEGAPGTEALRRQEVDVAGGCLGFPGSFTPAAARGEGGGRLTLPRDMLLMEV